MFSPYAASTAAVPVHPTTQTRLSMLETRHISAWWKPHTSQGSGRDQISEQRSENSADQSGSQTGDQRTSTTGSRTGNQRTSTTSSQTGSIHQDRSASPRTASPEQWRTSHIATQTVAQTSQVNSRAGAPGCEDTNLTEGTVRVQCSHNSTWARLAYAYAS